MPTTHSEQAEAARILRALSDRVARGEMDAPPTVAARLAGAVIGLEEAARRP